jgi:Domain of unknown function (DUF4286)
MFTYNVTIKIDKSIQAAWLLWMQETHLHEVLATGMFDSAQLHQLLEPQDEEGYTYVAQYTTSSIDNYNNYIANFAPALRDKGFALFGNKFIAFRSLLQQIV